MLLVIDQFEELFTLARTSRSGLTSCATSSRRWRSRQPPVGGRHLARRFLRPPPALRAFERAGGQAHRGGGAPHRRRAVPGHYRAGRAAGLGLEAALPAAIIEDVAEQPGTLPLMQYALTELYERREGRLLTWRHTGRAGACWVRWPGGPRDCTPA